MASQPHKSIVSLLIFLALFVFARPASSERLPVKIYTSADGLGSAFVDYLFRDSRGFMWFCTRDGLSRFDGSRFVTYDIGDEASPPGIENIFESSDGMYWMSTTGGTYRFDPNKISESEGNRPRLNAVRITGWRGGFFQDRNGVIWLASAGLFKLQEIEGKPEFVKIDLGIPPQPDKALVVFDVVETDDGSLWIQTSWGLVRRLTDGRSVFYSHTKLISGVGSNIIPDRSGRIWMTMDNELLVLKPEPAEAITDHDSIISRPFAPTEVIEIDPARPVRLPGSGGELYKFINKQYIDPWPSKRLRQTSDGSIWIGAEAYLLHITEGGRFLAYSSLHGLPSMMGRLAEDAAGNLWIGGQSALARLDRRGMTTFDAADGLPSSRFYSVTEDGSGPLYFAQSGFNIAAYDGRSFTSVRPNIPAAAKPLWMSRFLFRSSRGDFWVLTSEGLYRFSNVGKIENLHGRSPTAVYDASNGLKADGAFQIFEDSGGSIWISTRGGSVAKHGLARLKKGDDRFRIFSASDGLPDGKAPSSYAEDAFGNIWMGFYEGGLVKFDGERFTFFGTGDGLPESGAITDIHLDSKGRLWLASSNFGVFRIDDITAAKLNPVKIGTDQGLHSSNVRTLTEDRFGRIYAGTARGVDRISADMTNVKHYSVVDGLAADFVVDSHRDRNGDLWFVTNGGVSRLTPKPEERSAAPNVFIGGLRISGIFQSVPQLGEVFIDRGELGYTENNIQISFFGLDFQAAETLRFQYKLEPADADWGLASEVATVTYANLVPGSYRFSVRAVNSEGTVSSSPASVSFTILSPIWQRWWFVLGLALLIAGAAVALYRYRTARLREVNRALTEAKLAEESLRRSREERLRELEKVRSRIATDLHDDIGASLTQIAVLSEVAQAKVGQDNGGAAEPLTKITDVSNQLIVTMGDIVWSINPTKDHLSDLTQRMRRFAADVLTSRGIAFHLTAPSTGSEIIVNSSIRREVFLIFKESINNIVKHSGATEVRAEMSLSNDDLVFTITDNGIGFDPGNNGKGSEGNGIGSMKRRVAELDGSIRIDSESGRGTVITLNVPMVDRTIA